MSDWALLTLVVFGIAATRIALGVAVVRFACWYESRKP